MLVKWINESSIASLIHVVPLLSYIYIYIYIKLSSDKLFLQFIFIMQLFTYSSRRNKISSLKEIK